MRVNKGCGQIVVGWRLKEV